MDDSRRFFDGYAAASMRADADGIAACVYVTHKDEREMMKANGLI